MAGKQGTAHVLATRIATDQPMVSLSACHHNHHSVDDCINPERTAPAFIHHTKGMTAVHDWKESWSPGQPLEHNVSQCSTHNSRQSPVHLWLPGAFCLGLHTISHLSSRQPAHHEGQLEGLGSAVRCDHDGRLTDDSELVSK